MDEQTSQIVNLLASFAIALSGNKMSKEQAVKVATSYVQQMQGQAQSASQNNVSYAKDGGKIEYFVKKFGNGGSNINVTTEDTSKKAKKAAKRNASKAPNIGKTTRRTVGGAVDQRGGQHMYMGEDVNGTTTADTNIYIPQPGDTVVTQTYPIYRDGSVTKTYAPGTSEYESVMSRARTSPLLRGVLDSIRKTLGF